MPAIFWALSMTANVFNWLFNLQAGRVLSKEEFATLTVFTTLQYILNVPAGALSATVSRFTAYYTEKGEQEKHFYFFRQFWWLSWTIGITILSVFLIFGGSIQTFFGLESSDFIFIFASLLIPLFLLSFEKGTLSGRLAFIWVGILFVVEAATKLLFLLTSLKLPITAVNAALWSLPVAVFFTWFISVLIARSFHPLPVEINSKASKRLKETYKFLGNSVFAGLGAVLIYSLDVLLVKHFFSASQAGVYSTLSLLGKTLYFASGSLIGLLIPLTARAQAKGETGRTYFYILLGLVTFVGMSIWLSYLLVPDIIVTALLTERGLVAVPYLATYSLGMFFLVLINCFTTFSLAKSNYLPVRLTLVAAIIETILIFSYHQTLGQVVNIVFLTLFVLLLTVAAIEFLGITTEVIINNLTSFYRIFTSGNQSGFSKQRINILIFNWRDLKHIHAGGSEVYLQEMGKRFLSEKCRVTLFTSNDGMCLPDENTEGIHIIRRGGFITVYFWAVIYYLFKFRGKFDVILDSENGIPFFTPLFVRKPVILLVHHLHQDIFFKSLLPPFSWIANFLENFLMPWVYQKVKVVTVSNSTAEDLKKSIGIEVSSIISNGVDIKKYQSSEKSKIPLISYVGRLKKYKSVEILLLAFKNILTKQSTAQLVIAGDGDNLDSLKKEVLKMGITQNVKFLGKISEEEKIRLLGKSWVMVQPSFMEGWGITCLEANACGTPVIASRVSGLKDAVSEGVSGYLFEFGNYQELAQRLEEIMIDEEKRKLLSKTARIWSKKYDWTEQSKKFILLIEKILWVTNRQINFPETAVTFAHEIKLEKEK